MNCRNQRLSRYTGGTVAEGSYGYLYLQFVFQTEDWKDVSVKIANFHYRGHNYPVTLNENNLAKVPKEVIRRGEFKVDLFGGGITTNRVTIPVEPNNSSCGDEGASDRYYNAVINELTAKIDELSETKADNIVLDAETNTIQLTANGTPIGDAIDYVSCGIKSFDVDENDNITITLIDGRVIDLGHITGASGATFTPHISEDLILSWTNDKGLDNPAPVDISPFNNWIELEDGGEAPTQYTWEFM